MTPTKPPEDLRAAVVDVFDEYHRAEYNADSGTVVSLLPYADKAIRLCEAAALAALPEKKTKDVKDYINIGWNQAIATAQTNIHSVFGGTGK